MSVLHEVKIDGHLAQPYIQRQFGAKSHVFEPTSPFGGFDNLHLTSCLGRGRRRVVVRISWFARASKNPLRSTSAGTPSELRPGFLFFGNRERRHRHRDTAMNAISGELYPKMGNNRLAFGDRDARVLSFLSNRPNALPIPDSRRALTSSLASALFPA
jgi:hypothetical protein